MVSRASEKGHEQSDDRQVINAEVGMRVWSTEAKDIPKVIGHIDPCLAQFTILSIEERTYSV